MKSPNFARFLPVIAAFLGFLGKPILAESPLPPLTSSAAAASRSEATTNPAAPDAPRPTVGAAPSVVTPTPSETTPIIPVKALVASKLGPSAKQEEAVVNHLSATLTWYRQMAVANTWVVQPSDAYYENNQHDLTNEVLTSSFTYARAMVALIADGAESAKNNSNNSHQVRLTAMVAANGDRLARLRDQQSDLNSRIAAAPAQDKENLSAQRGIIDAEIDLNAALGDSLTKAVSLFANSGGEANSASLSSQIDALQRGSPEMFDSRGSSPGKQTPATTAPALPSDGLVGRAGNLFSLIRDQRSMDTLIAKTVELEGAAKKLAEPLGSELKSAMQAGNTADQMTADISDPKQLNALRDQVELLALQVRNLSAAFIPLRQESMALERSRSNLVEWKRSVISQTDVILRVLFARAISLLVALAVLIAVSEIWRRATFKYVHDVRRRRQFLLIRRFVTGILMFVTIVVAFVSDFSSLATFAGFITAGIAVALQTIILSVAAYFFLIGRYGIRVGDRVTVSGVTGDVIDIGLVRVFLMELAGTGIDLHPTGRVVVLANSALFSSTPLYKQLPGTDYAWREIYITMAADTDPGRVEEILLKAVSAVYESYRVTIERQHGALERLIDLKSEVPVPAAEVRLSDSGLEVVVRYPVEIRKMSEVDGAVTKAVLSTLRSDEDLKKSLTAMPRIRSAVKS